MWRIGTILAETEKRWVERWQKLTLFRRGLLTVFFTWLAWSGFDWTTGVAKNALPFLRPVSDMMDSLRPILMDRAVIAAIGTGLIIGFWTYIISFVRRLRLFSRQSIAVFSSGLGLSFVVIGLLYLRVWLEVQDHPRLFVPAPSATLNADKSGRDIEDKQPWVLEQIFQDNTKIIATQKTRGDIGKWIAVTGKIEDASSLTNGGTMVSLAGNQDDASLTTMTFGTTWSVRLQPLNKGQRIFAVCKIHSLTYCSMYLDQCELAPMVRIIPCVSCGIRWHADTELRRPL